jgi:hypothetical protein
MIDYHQMPPSLQPLACSLNPFGDMRQLNILNTLASPHSMTLNRARCLVRTPIRPAAGNRPGHGCGTWQ